MAQKVFVLRTISDKIVVEQPHHHELNYMIELEQTVCSKYHKLANYVIITRKDYQLLQIGDKFAQRV